MRITDMKQLLEILSRLRKNCSINNIHSELGAHKTVIRRVKQVASKHNWAKETDPVPSEDALKQAYRATFSPTKKKHPLDPYKKLIKEWKNDDKETFVVICHKLRRLLDGDRVPESTLRDYYHREIGKTPKIIIRRENNEMGIGELDFGYFGNTYKREDGCNRKTWFVSIRLRRSRQAARRKLYKAVFHYPLYGH